jgi:LysM repeat protein
MALAAPFPSVRTTPARRTAPARQSASRAPQVKAHLTGRGRVALVGASVLTILSVVVVSSQVADASDNASGSAATAVVVVQAGDSLWSIAQGVSSNVDPREMVSRIRELNALDTAVVVAGQSLVVPVA